MTASRTRTLTSTRTHTNQVGLLIPGTEVRTAETIDPSGTPAVVLTICNDVAAAHCPLSVPAGVDELIERLTEVRDRHAGPRLVVPEPGRRLIA